MLLIKFKTDAHNKYKVFGISKKHKNK